MSTAAETTARTPRSGAPRRKSPVYSALIGLSALAVLLQGVWAGLFQSQGYAERWVRFHDIGGEITLTLAVLSLVAAVIWLRHRTGLLVGTVVFALLVAFEWFVGNQIGGAAWFQAVHVPVAMVLLALAVYLPVLHGRGAQTGR